MSSIRTAKRPGMMIEGSSVNSYIDGGYVPEAVRNYLCLLGWSPKNNREKMALAE